MIQILISMEDRMINKVEYGVHSNRTYDNIFLITVGSRFGGSYSRCEISSRTYLSKTYTKSQIYHLWGGDKLKEYMFKNKIKDSGVPAIHLYENSNDWYKTAQPLAIAYNKCEKEPVEIVNELLISVKSWFNLILGTAVVEVIDHY